MMEGGRVVLVVDAANVVGSVPDGWWRDRAGATARLRDALAPLADGGLPAAGLDGPLDLILVVEGKACGVEPVDGVRVVQAAGSGDDALVDVVAEARSAGRSVVVATADRGLVARVEALGATVVGPRTVRGPVIRREPAGKQTREEGRMELTLVEGDLTRQQVDVIVNAANSTLLGGGGVDGAIHAAAGPRLLEECRRVRRTSWPEGLPVGEAVATRGYDLPARWVVHTVGPNRHRGQTDPALLAACFGASLRVAAGLADDDGPARSVAFPAISAGAYGWDPDDVARVAVAEVRRVAAAGEAPGIHEVRFVLFGSAVRDAFRRAL